MGVVDFEKINEYSSLITAIITLLYVVLTYYMLRSNNQMIEQTNRPYVFVYFEMINPDENTSYYLENQDIFLVIENRGNTAANNLQIKIEPDINFPITPIPGRLQLKDNPLINEPISFLPPGSKYRLFVEHRRLMFSYELRFLLKPYTIVYSYNGAHSKKTYNETSIENLSNKFGFHWEKEKE